MKTNILIPSLFINIVLILVGIYFFYTSNHPNVDTSSNNEINNSTKNIDNSLSKIEPTDIESTNAKTDKNFCSNIIEWKDKESELWKMYLKYINISEDSQSITDWNIFTKIFIEKKCDFFDKSSVNHKMCKIVVSKNLALLEWNDDEISFIKSYWSWTNQCGESSNCMYNLDLLSQIKNKKIKFPESTSNSRNIEFYAYRQVSSLDYKDNLDKLFLSECTNIRTTWN